MQYGPRDGPGVFYFSAGKADIQTDSDFYAKIARIMLNDIINYTLPFSFTILVACALTCLVSMLMIFLFRIRRINEAMQHPYLKKLPWERHTFGMRATILLDYFLRIMFPRRKKGMAGQANLLLAHIDPTDVPNSLKWPIIGMWGGCLLGLIVMPLLWIMIYLKMNAGL